MRTLIRCKASKEFLTPDGTWSRDIAAARVFKDTHTLLKHRGSLDRHDLEVYYSFAPDKPTEWDFTSALNNSSRPASPDP